MEQWYALYLFYSNRDQKYIVNIKQVNTYQAASEESKFSHHCEKLNS
jgi:hypothetical protein